MQTSFVTSNNTVISGTLHSYSPFYFRRPLNPDEITYKQIIKKTYDDIKQLAHKIHYIDLNIPKDICDIINSYIPTVDFEKYITYIFWDTFVEINTEHICNYNDCHCHLYPSAKLSPNSNVLWLTFDYIDRGVKDFEFLCNILNRNYPNLRVLEYEDSFSFDRSGKTLEYVLEHTNIEKIFYTSLNDADTYDNPRIITQES